MTAPAPPLLSFASDNTAPAHPKVLEALGAANSGTALPYGADPWTERAQQRFATLFGPEIEVLFTYGGTGANIVALQSLLAPHEAVICPVNAHINVDECGAPERFVGAKLIAVPAPEGKLSPDVIPALMQGLHDEHNARPRVVAISQSTEVGTLYTVEEITELSRVAHENGLIVYVDGARIANAVAALGRPIRQLTRDAGIDVVTFGGTKNGLVYGEALVFLRPELAMRARYARKQAAQLASKMRFIAAQFDALLTDDLWLSNAAHSNQMAAALAERVSQIPQVEVAHRVEVNSVFARLPAAAISVLQEWSFFWPWDPKQNLVRWMTNFATTEEDVDRFADGVSYFATSHAP
ncbi:MAG TPA: low specificity L-threonine aldolase [Acidimicrobiales bacterium]|nr:low specificity L-threonine aldolase [Acidimicrobiales bacterium]